MKKVTFLFILSLVFTYSHSQIVISPSIISSAGNVDQSSSVKLDWTLGETIIETGSTERGLYTQGFHQSTLSIKKSYIVKHYLGKEFEINIAPNPVQSVLTVSVKSTNNEIVYVTLIDFLGNRLLKKIMYGKRTSVIIDMSERFAGFYILEFRNSKNEVINNYKTIKIN